MLEFILAGVSLGLSGGLKPGPLGVYVIHQTVTRGYSAGLKASFAPFASDGPIILAAFFLLDSFRHTPYVLAGISIAGAIYLVNLALRMFRVEGIGADAEAPSSFFTAVKINLLNPIPYMFWMTAGGAYLIKGDIDTAIIFSVTMLLTLGTTKFILAASIRALGEHFDQGSYIYLVRILAVMLIGFATKLIYDGLAYI